MTPPAEPSSGRSPLLAVLVALAVVVGVVMLVRRSGDAPAPAPSTTASSAPATGAPVVDLAAAKKQVASFLHEAEVAHFASLVDAGQLLDAALSKDDCIGVRPHYDVIKETKTDLTTHSALVLAQIRMLTTVGAYCNAWTDPTGTKHW
jgi:hypothetical protein